MKARKVRHHKRGPLQTNSEILEAPSAVAYPRRANDGLTGNNPPWTKERRLAASEFAAQVAKSPWLRIQCVNRVSALTLTMQVAGKTKYQMFPPELDDLGIFSDQRVITSQT